MSTPQAAPTFDPSVPMTAKWRSDIAWRLAQGWTWKELGETLKCDPDELRFATETDPEFAAAQEVAWTRVIFDADADGMRRLRQIANNGSDSSAQNASKVLAEYADRRRERDVQLALEDKRIKARIEVEKIRADAKIAVEKLRNERAALKAQSRREEAEEDEWVGPPRIVKETEEEFQKRSDREHAERAAQPSAKVYLWGGKHQLGRSIPPDASDIRVCLKDDWSVPAYGGESNLIYWIVPREANVHAPGPREAQAAAALKETFDANPPALGT